MNYTIEDLKNTWQFPFERSNEIIKDIRDGLKDFSSNYDTLCELGNEKFCG